MRSMKTQLPIHILVLRLLLRCPRSRYRTDHVRPPWHSLSRASSRPDNPRRAAGESNRVVFDYAIIVGSDIVIDHPLAEMNVLLYKPVRAMCASLLCLLSLALPSQTAARTQEAQIGRASCRERE